jgi:hypothetical protein
MKILRITCCLVLLAQFRTSVCQETQMELPHYWQLGFGLGELPTGGSFKPSISIGYHFNDKVYAGIIYQFRDEIRRNESSINAKSSGFVYNGRDTETMLFDSRSRELSGENYEGSIFIQQSRPAGWGFALGLGYQYNFKNGFSTGVEWTPAWGQYPVPEYVFGGEAHLSDQTQGELQQKMNDEFKSSVTNMYKVFHIGVAYRFQ